MEPESINDDVVSLTREESDDVRADAPLAEHDPELEDLPQIAVNEYESCTITDFSDASFQHRLAWWKQN
jgi:hypothetical protein